MHFPRHPRSDDSSAPPRADCPSMMDLAAWRDGTLSEDRAGAVALHLTECASCRDAAEGVADAAPRLPDEARAHHEREFDPRAVARLVSRAEALVAAPAPYRIRRPMRTVLAVAAALLLAVVGWQAAMLLSAPTTSGGASPDGPGAVALGTPSAESTIDFISAGSQSSSDETALLTFGLLEDLSGAALLDIADTESTGRSDS